MFWLQLSANICTIFVDFQHQQMFNETCLFDWSLLTPRLSAPDWKLTNWPSSQVQVCSYPLFLFTLTKWKKNCEAKTLWLELTHVTIQHTSILPIINTACWLTDTKEIETWVKTLKHTIRHDLHYNIQVERGRLSTTSVDPVRCEGRGQLKVPS